MAEQPSQPPSLPNAPAGAESAAASSAATSNGEGASTPPAPVATRRSGVWLGLVALIAIAALGLSAWQAYNGRFELQGLRQELAKRLADVDAQSKTGRVAGEQLREATREASVKIGVLESKLAESQSQQIALEALYQDLSRNRDEWAFAEIEQTLLVANQQLQLAGNVRAALIALQAVDSRLQHMKRPQLALLHKAINDDIARLKAAPFVDTAGLSVRIDTTIAEVDKLPLAAETRLPDQPAASDEPADVAQTTPGATAWSLFLQEMWADFRKMVRVQRIDNPDVPLLAPAQSFFLRENLKLRLLTARMALLTRDQATFRGDLKAAREWVTRYFDTDDKAVVSTLETLAALQKSTVSIELPDLSTTLSALRSAAPVAENENK